MLEHSEAYIGCFRWQHLDLEDDHLLQDRREEPIMVVVQFGHQGALEVHQRGTDRGGGEET